MLTDKYVISPINGKEYCRKNGQFLRHLKTSGFNDYQQFFDEYFPEDITQCACGDKNTFNKHKMAYNSNCGTRQCVNAQISDTKHNFTDGQWEQQKYKFQETMALKTEDEKQQIINSRVSTGKERNSFSESVKKREDTCERVYGNMKYNNSEQISITKLEWTNSRKELFLERLAKSLGGKRLCDFHTTEMFVRRRKTLEDQGMVTPLDQLTEWELYRNKTRTLTRKVYNENKHLINPKNLPRKIRQYELDHIVPVMYGFMNDIPEELISSVDNLQMLPMSENRQKSFKYDPK